MKKNSAFRILHSAFSVMFSAFLFASLSATAQTFVKPTDKNIQYIGRISFANPNAPAWNYTGTTIRVEFTGTSLKMKCKPESGYFMATVNKGKAFKVAFADKNDSIATIASDLVYGVHSAEIMYCIEGHDNNPEFYGFILDEGEQTVPPTLLSDRKIEFIGNSITCGYGVEDPDPNHHFDYAAENHHLSYAAITARRLDAQHFSVSRSGIGIYRHYGSSSEGSEVCMPKQYAYTRLYNKSEKWDFSRFQPDVVCINLGTNDTSPDLESAVSNSQNHDPNAARPMGCNPTKLKAAYKDFLKTVRGHYPNAKIVMLCGSMLQGDGLKLISDTMDEVVAEANKAGDKEIYRFNFTPQDGSRGYGADWHPSIAQQQFMADELTPYLQKLMGW